MKKIITLFAAILLSSASFAQGNLNLSPASGTVCFNTEVSLQVTGNVFTPVKYWWSTGDTTPTIHITNSGFYLLLVQGYTINPNNPVYRIRFAAYNVLPEPQIAALSELWVCKGDSVLLEAATPGYTTYTWSTGATGTQLYQVMNNPGTPGIPSLDTLTVSYTATIDGVCSTTSESVVLRAIRKPHGVGAFYNGKMDIAFTDSIPAGLVLEYLHPVTYIMEFTDIADPGNQLELITAPGSRRIAASNLEQGKSYSVVTTPVINGQMFCPGMACTIGIASTTPRLAFGFSEESEISTYTIYDLSGRVLFEKEGSAFNNEWLENISSQMLVISRKGKTSEVIKMQLMH